MGSHFKRKSRKSEYVRIRMRRDAVQRVAHQPPPRRAASECIKIATISREAVNCNAVLDGSLMKSFVYYSFLFFTNRRVALVA